MRLFFLILLGVLMAPVVVAIALLAIVFRENRETNQCMGCQAKWKFRSEKVHEVPPPGYPGELVACTAERYK